MDANAASVFVGVLMVVVTYFVQYYLNRFTKNQEKKAAELKEQQEKIEKFLEESETNHRWNTEQQESIEEAEKNLQEFSAKLEMLISGGSVLLCDRIGQSCLYFVEHGYITTIAKENIIKMYSWYLLMTKNKEQYLEYLYKKAMNLPVDDTKQHLNIPFPDITSKEK